MRVKNQLTKIISPLLILYLTLAMSQMVFSQPPLPQAFSPYETCNKYYFDYDYVFVGKVTSAYTETFYRVENSGTLADYVIEVVKPIKGNLKKSVILTAESFSHYDRMHFVLGNLLIFTANKNTRSGLKGEFVSRYWSTPIGNTPSKIINRKVKQMKRVIKGNKLPQIHGKVVQHFTSPYYFKFAYFDGEYELGYDPEYSEPSPRIVVTAKATDGKIYKTFTGIKGEYRFTNLPNSRYLISLSLPANHQVKSVNGKTSNLEKHFFVRVNDNPCGKSMNLAVSEVGNLEAEIGLANVSWEKNPTVQLVAVNPDNLKVFNGFVRYASEINFDKQKKKLIVYANDFVAGEYILEIKPSNSTRYIAIPTVKDRIAQETICIRSGKTTKVKLSL